MFQFSANKTLCLGLLLQNPPGGLPPQGILTSLSLLLCDAAESSLLHDPQPLGMLLSSKPLSPSGLNLSQTWGLIHVLHCDDCISISSEITPFFRRRQDKLTDHFNHRDTHHTKRENPMFLPILPSGGPSLNSRVDTLTFVTLLIDSLVHSRGAGCYFS